MSRLFQLIYRYRAFLIFLVFELLCFWLMVRSNPYHSAAFFSSSNQIAGNIYTTKENITSYFSLKKVNENLAEENAELREELYTVSRPVIVRGKLDSAKIPEVGLNYSFISAKVINNTTYQTHNHFTINKGARQGIRQGMGVISANGVVGIIKSVSGNFSTAYSILNNNVLISAELKKSNTLCTVNWGGLDPRFARVLYLPRHIDVEKGDTVITSGFNAVFPEKILIGTVEEVNLNENESFYNIRLRLAADLTSLSYVYVVDNPKKEEQLNLEQEVATNE